MNLKSFIFCSTLLSIFTEALSYNMGFDLKFFYFIIFLNFVTLFLFNKIVYSNGLFVFHSLILVNGAYTCIFGYNGLSYFLIQLFFLLVIPIYYYSFFSLSYFKIETIVKSYCKLSLILAIIGLIKLPYDISEGKALHSLMLEPAHYCTIVLPAYFFLLKNRTYPRYYSLIILVTIILSGSSLGFIGLGLCLLFYSKKLTFIKTSFAFLITISLGLALYFTFDPFKVRLDDTVNSVVGKDLSKANLSTYALLSNFYVSYNSFLSNPLIGNGIGSHINSRKLYLHQIDGIDVFEKMGMDHLNAQDAGSLFSRLMSETGLIGLFGVLYFITKFYVTNKDEELSFNAVISRGILIYFFAKLFREGHYFSPEMYFFVMLYVFNKFEHKKGELNLADER